MRMNTTIFPENVHCSVTVHREYTQSLTGRRLNWPPDKSLSDDILGKPCSETKWMQPYVSLDLKENLITRRLGAPIRVWGIKKKIIRRP